MKVLMMIPVAALTVLLASCVKEPDPRWPLSCGDGALAKSAASCMAPEYHPWSQPPPAMYSFTFARQCFCDPDHTGPFFVTVENGIVTQALQGSTEADFAHAPGSLQSYALDSIWAQANTWLSRYYASAFVRHDATWGFPDSFFIDHAEEMADDEHGFTITDFRNLAD